MRRSQDAQQSQEAALRTPASATTSPESAGEKPGYFPWPEEPDLGGWKPLMRKTEKAKPKQLNAAALNRVARKMMAREWARAKGTLGQKRQREMVADMERTAEEYKRRQREKQALIEQARREEGHAADKVQQAILSFGAQLASLSSHEAALGASDRISKSLESIGLVHHIHWRPEGCDVVIELWEDRRRRRIGDTLSLPVLYRVSVDEQLQIVNCAHLDGEDRESWRLESIRDGIFAALRQQGRTPEALRNALEQIGRVSRQFPQPDGGIKVSVEPWEDYRRRKWEEGRRRSTEPEGQPPIEAYLISADATLQNISCEAISEPSRRSPDTDHREPASRLA